MWEEYWTWVCRYWLLHECTLRGSDGFFTHDEGPRGQQDTSSTFSISVVDLKKEEKKKRSADDLKHKQKIEREPESYFEKVI